MHVLFIVSTPGAGRLLAPMTAACRRRGTSWSCFFTSDGVRVLDDHLTHDAVKHADQAVACEHSWERYQGDARCPVTLGSQTNNSAMVSEATKVIGL